MSLVCLWFFSSTGTSSARYLKPVDKEVLRSGKDQLVLTQSNLSASEINASELYHYSHKSHVSHASHQSHYSHRSGY